MANPKRRTTRSRQGMRRSHQKLKNPTLTVCPQCQEPKLPHRACPSCGYYKSRKVIDVKIAE